MASEKDLAHLLKLLEDDSAVIRDKVWGVLSANLPAWRDSILLRLGDLPPASRKRVERLFAEKTREGFRAAWGRWREQPDERGKLETALSGLSAYLSGKAWTGAADSPLGDLLDGLAAEFRAGDRPVTPSRLALFLFSEKGLRGAEADYYDPRNSDLVQVIEKGRGIPISLACVFMLTARRLDLEVAGCDVPEHFLTRAREGGEELIIDCYDGGKVLDQDRLAQLELKYAPDFQRLLRASAPAEAIIARVLRNLINAYHLAGDKQASDFMWSLAEDLRGLGREDEGSEAADPEN